jgi:hypothetical protein
LLPAAIRLLDLDVLAMAELHDPKPLIPVDPAIPLPNDRLDSLAHRCFACSLCLTWTSLSASGRK